MEEFKLSEQFLEQFKNKQPNFGPLGYITFKRTYARPLENGSTEEFWQTVQRVVEGVYAIQKNHCKHLRLPWSQAKAQRSAQEMFLRMWQFKFLPPGRGLWAMGTSIIDKVGGAALNNCAFRSTQNLKTDFSGPFTFCMDMMMLGVGVGFDTTGENTILIKEPKTTDEVYVVEDSREGWVALASKVLDSFVGRESFPTNIDYSNIRKEGEPLKTFGGVSSGYKPLEELVSDIWNILSSCVGELIESTDIVDIMNVIGRCVVAGNVRRSAELALGSSKDETFLNIKNPELHAEALSHHRWASNNSLSVNVGEDYTLFGELTAKNGEPGYVWLENCRSFGRMGENGRRDGRCMGVNPCSEQTLEDGELCCLVETFPSNHESLEDYKRTLKFAYLYSKTVTLVPTHDELANSVMMRNRRIGTSQSGIVQNFQKIGRREHFRWCDEGYNYIRELDEKYSDWLCVPKSIKVTSVKPSGTVSLLPGVTPGIHYAHSEYYFRLIRFNSESPLLEPLRKSGYKIEKDSYSPNTSVVYFAVHEQHFDRSKNEVSMWEQLENVAQMQRYWSDNAVSATITFNSEEAKDIPKALELYDTRLKTISFLPVEDHGYVQAPYQTITKEEYESYVKSIKVVKSFKQTDTHEVAELYCDSDSCVLV